MNTSLSGREIFVQYINVNGCAQFGKKEFSAALSGYNVKINEINHWVSCAGKNEPVIVVGTTAERNIQILLENAGVSYHLEPESVIYQWCETHAGRVLVISGSDDVGLMYALLEMAERIEAGGYEALVNTENLTESPDNRIRGMDRYIVGHLDDEWFKSEEFWHYYLARLAKARFNRFYLIVGFDTPYLTPPYPFFTTVEGYENITVEGLSDQARDDNLRALRRVGQLCKEYGLMFGFATWQQRPWTESQKQMVNGLPEDEKGLSEYCYHGLRALIRAVPEIDIVQFRVNHESGVGTQVSAEDFWNHCTDAVAEIAQEDNRPLILDLRAKGLTDAMIDYAFSKGLHVEVPTKYWCEHAALPHHLSIMRTEELERLDNFNHSRRYSYADMLKKPKYYDVFYRLWNYGSTNLFIWGDADYARRFSRSCSLSNSIGFTINSPLALKYGYELLHKDAWHTFADPSLRSGKWEDERFWMWYIAYGRLGYSADTDPEVWKRVFRKHFGEKSAEVIERGLRAASKIVPFVTTIHMPVHPSLRYWTEMSTGGALFYQNNIHPHDDVSYGATEPSDHGLFYGIDEFAEALLSQKLSGKYSPLQSAQWLVQFAEDTYRAIEQADAIGENSTNAEYRAMKTDMLLLCDFARYHANKILSAFALKCFDITKDKSYLSDCVLLFKQAKKYWSSLSELGLKAYHHDLEFSTAGTKTRHGTWKELLSEFEADEKTLLGLVEEYDVELSSDLAHCYTPVSFDAGMYTFSENLPETHKANTPLTIEVNACTLADLYDKPFVLHYRHTNHLEGEFKTIKMEPTDRGFRATIPAEYLPPEWDLMVYVTMQDKDGSCLMLPGIYHPKFPYPYHVISVLK